MFSRQLTRFNKSLWLVAALCIALCSCIATANANYIPPNAYKHKAELTRTAHAVWGLNAPIPMFAAQIHQESGWRAVVVSNAGALGMAQFMPATATWWCQANGLSADSCQPNNPTWAMRAMIGYDKWLYARVRGNTEYDRLHAALRSYNGGLGHWQLEAKRAGSYVRLAVDAACGKARRSRVHCAENLGYPNRILQTLQPRYASWGRVVLVSLQNGGVNHGMVS